MIAFQDGFIAISLLLAVTLPLISGILSFTTSERYSWLIILNAPFLLLLGTIFGFITALNNWNTSGIIPLPWLQMAGGDISANIYLSQTSLLMMVVVLSISFLVHVYSVGYMAGDENPRKYFGMLGLFTFAMLGIVLADNLFVLFIFWELVGFSSYMLIGHWNEKPEAGKAASKAFLYNRIGDAAFLIGIMIIWRGTGTFEISALVEQTFQWQTAATLCIFGGVAGKSAQLPLVSWLSDAMEGPTPVSALIHAATMVAAGVYLMIRVHPIFTETALVIIGITGATTAVAAAASALVQYDIKKVLAYSTISQLGLMIIAISVGSPDAAFLHLLTHAFFKACLFLSAGSVIHALHQAQRRDHTHIDVQDMRNLGGLKKVLPTTFLTFVVSGASLAGLPLLSGFISKEAIYASTLQRNDSFSLAMFIMVAIISFLTVLYTFRLIWFTFLNEGRNLSGLQVQESPVIMRLPMLLLAAASIWLVVSINPLSYKGWLSMRALSQPWWLFAFSTAWVSLALIIATKMLRKSQPKTNRFIANGFGVDAAYRLVFKRPVEHASVAVTFIDKKIIDQAIHLSAYAHVTLGHIIGWVDKYFVDGMVRMLAAFIRVTGSIARSFQSGKIQDYILYAVLALIIFLIWVL